MGFVGWQNPFAHESNFLFFTRPVPGEAGRQPVAAGNVKKVVRAHPSRCHAAEPNITTAPSHSLNVLHSVFFSVSLSILPPSARSRGDDTCTQQKFKQQRDVGGEHKKHLESIRESTKRNFSFNCDSSFLTGHIWVNNSGKRERAWCSRSTAQDRTITRSVASPTWIKMTKAIWQQMLSCWL